MTEIDEIEIVILPCRFYYLVPENVLSSVEINYFWTISWYQCSEHIFSIRSDWSAVILTWFDYLNSSFISNWIAIVLEFYFSEDVNQWGFAIVYSLVLFYLTRNESFNEFQCYMNWCKSYSLSLKLVPNVSWSIEFNNTNGWKPWLFL